MPRKPRLDTEGALHHVMVRGLERRKEPCQLCGDWWIWDVTDAGGQGIEYIRAKCSSWVGPRGAGNSKKGMGDCGFPKVTELSELRSLATIQSV